MHPIEVLALMRTIDHDRQAEAEQIRTYRRLRVENRRPAQPHLHRARRPIMARLHAWKTA